MLETDKGLLVNKYFTPLMEKYENAPEPYEEYKYGVDIVSYDSLENVKSTFRANYAIRFINLNLWEAKGDVVVTNEKGDRLETQQLFWNRATGRVYSNVDSHFFLGEGIIRGEGFESKQDLSDWEVRSTIGTIMVNTEPTRDTIPRDSLPESVTEGGQVNNPLPPSREVVPAQRRGGALPADRHAPQSEEGGSDESIARPEGEVPVERQIKQPEGAVPVERQIKQSERAVREGRMMSPVVPDNKRNNEARKSSSGTQSPSGESDIKNE